MKNLSSRRLSSVDLFSFWLTPLRSWSNHPYWLSKRYLTCDAVPTHSGQSNSFQGCSSVFSTIDSSDSCWSSQPINWLATKVVWQTALTPQHSRQPRQVDLISAYFVSLCREGCLLWEAQPAAVSLYLDFQSCWWGIWWLPPCWLHRQVHFLLLVVWMDCSWATA